MSLGANLLRYSDQKLLFWDFESCRVNTCMDNLPFQWSAAEANRERIVKTHNHYLHWPDYRMSKDAATITRFNPAWVANGDDPELILDKWESYALDPSYLLVGHNVMGFDVPLWNLWRRALGRPSLWSVHPHVMLRVIDTHLLSRAWKEGFKPDCATPEARWAWQMKVSAAHRKGVKTNLTQMCKDLAIPIDETKTHEAGYDLDLTHAVYTKLIGLIEI